MSHSAETAQLLGLTWRTTRLEVFSNRLACFGITVSIWVFLSWRAIEMSTSPYHRYATLVSLIKRLNQLPLGMAMYFQTVSATVRVRCGWPEQPMYIIVKVCIYLTLCGLTIPMAVIDWYHEDPRYLFMLRHAALPIYTFICLAFTGAFVNDFDS